MGMIRKDWSKTWYKPSSCFISMSLIWNWWWHHLQIRGLLRPTAPNLLPTAHSQACSNWMPNIFCNAYPVFLESLGSWGLDYNWDFILTSSCTISSGTLHTEIDSGKSYLASHPWYLGENPQSSSLWYFTCLQNKPYSANSLRCSLVSVEHSYRYFCVSLWPEPSKLFPMWQFSSMMV